jgi:hypothetical protein
MLEKNKHRFGISRILEKKLDARLTKFENYKILLSIKLATDF